MKNPIAEKFIKIDVDYFSVLAFCRVDIYCSCVILLSEFQRTVEKVVQKDQQQMCSILISFLYFTH